MGVRLAGRPEWMRAGLQSPPGPWLLDTDQDRGELRLAPVWVRHTVVASDQWALVGQVDYMPRSGVNDES
jgi:hypothetical protein